MHKHSTSSSSFRSCQGTSNRLRLARASQTRLCGVLKAQSTTGLMSASEAHTDAINKMHVPHDSAILLQGADSLQFPEDTPDDAHHLSCTTTAVLREEASCLAVNHDMREVVSILLILVRGDSLKTCVASQCRYFRLCKASIMVLYTEVAFRKRVHACTLYGSNCSLWGLCVRLESHEPSSFESAAGQSSLSCL